MSNNIEYITKYQKENYSTLTVFVPKGEKQRWKEFADSRGYSMRELIQRAAEQYMHNHPIK